MTWFAQETVVERAPSRHSSSHRNSHTKSSRMSLDTVAADTTCSKGHIHPPWPTSGLLRIAKCESVCGFCQKETKTAANLRKHVAIHIKNEGMNLQIAEGSSGRGRLEMPLAQSGSASSSTSTSSRLSQVYDEDDNMSTASNSNYSYNKRPDPFSPSQALMSMSSRPTYTTSYSQSSSSYSQPSYSSPSTPQPSSFSPPPAPPLVASQTGSFYDFSRDPFKALREHNMSTKSAWTVITAAEGARILEYCKSKSVAQHSNDRGRGYVPCYNRETIFDEEWQAHMKDVHGVFCLWPATWMRRIEVLDLDEFNGDIGACNEVIMEREK